MLYLALVNNLITVSVNPKCGIPFKLSTEEQLVSN